MDDLISRQAAIDALKAIKYGLWEIDIPSPGSSPEYKEHHKQMQEMMGVVDNWIDKLSDLPSAQPERKTGKWIGTEFDGYADGNPVYYEWKCSSCGCVVEDEEPTWNFCPNCGAFMKGEQEC